MEYLTYTQIKTKLQNDLDLVDEDFVTEEELLGYMNEAIDDTEAVIHNLGLETRYFLNTDTLSLVSGTSDYDMPSDIYGNKMARVFYINGSKKYEVYRMRDLNEIPWVQTGEDYRYLVVNLTSGLKQRFFPTPAESGSFIQRWYIRNVRKLTTSAAATNTCELPECVNMMLQHCKVRIYEKEGNPNLQKAMADLKLQHDLMVENLQEMVPDGNNQVMPDYSFYDDMYLDFGWRY